MHRGLLVIIICLLSCTMVQAQDMCFQLFPESRRDMPLEMRLSYLEQVLPLSSAALSDITKQRPSLWQMLRSPEARSIEDKYSWAREQHRRLQFEQYNLKKVTELIEETRNVFNISPDEEIELLNRMTDSPNLRFALDLIHAMMSQSYSVAERAFWTGSLAYMIYGAPPRFFRMPFHHWLLAKVLDARQNKTRYADWAVILATAVRSYRSNEFAVEDKVSEALQDIFIAQFDPVVITMNRMAERDMMQEYRQAIAEGLIKPHEVNLLRYSVPDLRPITEP